MMKIISQISLIVLIMMVGLVSIFVTEVYAESLAGINCVSSVNQGETFTVSLIYPSEYEITSAQADVTVTYSDNSKQTDVIVYMNREDMQSDQKAKFTANVAGTAQISVTNILMVKNDGTTVESSGSKTVGLTVVEKSSGNNNSGNGNTSSGNTSNNGNSAGTESPTPSNPSTQPTTPSTPQNTPSVPKFTDVNEIVYTTTKCNLRESYSTDSNKLDSVDIGTKLTRKGIGDNGWSKCEYNGKNVYVLSKYLTTTVPESNKEEKESEKVEFKDTKENLYAKQNCNIRASWSTESEKVGYLVKGQAIERTGYADNGWSRILYNGKTAYVASRLLSVDKPEEEKKTEENTVKNETIIDSTIINEEVEKGQISDAEMLNIIKEEVGVLPEVGTNIANIAYVIVTIISLCGFVSGVIYIKNK